MKNIFFFNAMLTPKIITVIYWLLLLSTIIGGVISMNSGYYGFDFSSFLMGMVYIIGGMIGARVSCELVMVIFTINENLKIIADKSE